MTTECTGTARSDGRCSACREVMFPHIWERAQRKLAKPAARQGLLPVGIRRKQCN